jgi:peptide/nickel transport system permease protein
MFQYIIKRLLLMVVTLFGIAAITFVLTRLTPGDPAAMRVQGAAGGASQAVGGYDDLVELNRRNLGLDKPMLLNFYFEDRDVLANRALDDFLRQGAFWQKDGERRLGRLSTIALPHALNRFKYLTENPDSIDTDKQLPQEEQLKRLAGILNRLTAENLPEEMQHQQPENLYTYWSAWYGNKKDRYGEERVEKLVNDYLSTDSEEQLSSLQTQVYQAGGYAIPYLIEGLDTSSLRKQQRINQALQAQTGFSFVVGENQFEGKAPEIMQRWRSWWRREKISYTKYGFFGNSWNIFANTQFGLWISQAIHLDFGDSYIKRKPVISLISDALPISLLLSGLSILIGYILAIPLGIFSAVKKNSPGDKLVTVILFLLYSLPSFWVAGILLMTLTGPPFLDFFPTRGLNSTGVSLGAEGITNFAWFSDRVWHLVLPVTCLTYGSLAFISRQMRSAMLETINQDFIRTAKAKGLSSYTVIFKHALRNSLIPIITISAGLLPELIAGAVIIESIFTIPGMGTLTFEAIVNRDYPVINAVLFFSAFMTLLGILVADISYALVDPRIKYE